MVIIGRCELEYSISLVTKSNDILTCVNNYFCHVIYIPENKIISIVESQERKKKLELKMLDTVPSELTIY